MVYSGTLPCSLAIGAITSIIALGLEMGNQLTSLAVFGSNLPYGLGPVLAGVSVTALIEGIGWVMRKHGW